MKGAGASPMGSHFTLGKEGGPAVDEPFEASFEGACAPPMCSHVKFSKKGALLHWSRSTRHFVKGASAVLKPLAPQFVLAKGPFMANGNPAPNGLLKLSHEEGGFAVPACRSRTRPLAQHSSQGKRRRLPIASCSVLSRSLSAPSHREPRSQANSPASQAPEEPSPS